MVGGGAWGEQGRGWSPPVPPSPPKPAPEPAPPSPAAPVRAHLGGPVPEGDDAGGVGDVVGAEVAGEAEVAELELAGVGEEEVGELDVAVDDPAVVEEGDGLEELPHEALDLAEGEGAAERVDEAGEVVLAELEGEEDGVRGRAREHPPERHDVGVPAPLQDPDLADGRHGDAVSLPVHAHALERHHLPRLLVPRLVHHPVRPLPDPPHLLVVRHRVGHGQGPPRAAPGRPPGPLPLPGAARGRRRGRRVLAPAHAGRTSPQLPRGPPASIGRPPRAPDFGGAGVRRSGAGAAGGRDSRTARRVDCRPWPLAGWERPRATCGGVRRAPRRSPRERRGLKRAGGLDSSACRAGAPPERVPAAAASAQGRSTRGAGPIPTAPPTPLPRSSSPCRPQRSVARPLPTPQPSGSATAFRGPRCRSRPAKATADPRNR